MPMWDVLGVGCNSVDHVYRLPASPKADSPTAKLRISSHAAMSGGQTATAMAACAAFGLKAAYLGAVGNDDHGRAVRRDLERRGVDVTPLLTRECETRFAVITVDETSGDRIVLWARDERLNLSRADMAADLIASARLVHVDDEDQEGAIAAATLARGAGVPCTSDIERITDRTRALIEAVSVPIFAEHVLPAISGDSNLERALRAVRRPHHTMACVTLGSRGAMLLAGDELIEEPAFPVQAVDTTGAGDVFRAGIIYGLLNEMPAREMLRFANAAAAAACTRPGAMAGVPTIEDVRRLIDAATLR